MTHGNTESGVSLTIVKPYSLQDIFNTNIFLTNTLANIFFISVYVYMILIFVYTCMNVCNLYVLFCVFKK